MALRKQGDRNGKMFIAWDELPKSPGHVFYDRLQSLLNKAGFDSFVEGLCAPLYASRKGRPSIPPGRYFRMHLIGYFEGIEWRCSESLSLREFLLLDTGQSVPDHSSLSRIRSRLPLELHQEIFTWVLDVITQTGLVQGDRIGVAASTMEKVGKAPSLNNPTELIADKGYHSRAVLKELDDSLWKTRIAEPKRKGLNWWNGDHEPCTTTGYD